MRHRTIFAILLLTLMGRASIASAQSDPLQKLNQTLREGTHEEFAFTFEERTRWEEKDGVNFGKSVNQQDMLSRLRVGASYTPVSWLTLSAMGQDARAPFFGRAQLSVGLPRPPYYRPPGGSLGPDVTATAKAVGEQTLFWKVDTEDWKAAGSGDSYWVKRIRSRANAGGGQAHPFVMHPPELQWPSEPVVSSEAVHRILRTADSRASMARSISERSTTSGGARRIVEP